MAKPPAAARLLALPMAIIAGVALVDDLGKYHWFWPYDRTIYSVALLLGVIWYVAFGERMKAWVKEEQARLDHEKGNP